MRTRDEHVEWSKQRALRNLATGDLEKTIAVMMSDLRSHPETENHKGIDLGVAYLLTGQFNDREEVRRWIEGFH